MNELSVAVIDNVKQIKLSAQPSRRAWIIHEAIQEAVSIEATPRGCLPARETATQMRRETRRGERIGVVLLQVVAEHLADEIHAGPVFFNEVAKNGEARGFRLLVHDELSLGRRQLYCR